ncbi:toll/interleukin-1 receptor domain-containing protein [Brevibacterium permense]|nr:toll/interleukin-1 receptor domain-containing protein [Brevibacterium permense]
MRQVMTADLFLSYAWTSDQHRQWVRLLAAHLKALGYDVLVDADVGYGDSLNGFMRRVVDSDHVLMIVDDNYVARRITSPNPASEPRTAGCAKRIPRGRRLGSRSCSRTTSTIRHRLGWTNTSPRGSRSTMTRRTRTTSRGRSRWTNSGAGSRACPRTRTRLRPSPSCASGPPGSSATN